MLKSCVAVVVVIVSFFVYCAEYIVWVVHDRNKCAVSECETGKKFARHEYSVHPMNPTFLGYCADQQQ